MLVSKSTIPIRTTRTPALSAIRIPALDGLRGIAILLVMMDHYGAFVLTGRSFWQPRLASIAQRGYLGVDLFFVLSGFLITGILIDTRDSSHYWSRFYWRRCLRIFPLYFFYLILIFGVFRPIYPSLIAGVNPLWYFTYVANWHMAGEVLNRYFAHLWSLCVEEQFYLVWPFVVLLSGKRLAWFCVAVAVSALMFRVLFVGHINPAYIYMLTPSRMDALAAGGFIAVVVRNKRLRAYTRAAVWPLSLMSAAVWAFSLGTKFERTAGYSAAALFFAMVVFWAVDQGPSILKSAPLRTFGKYSYGLYMFHVLFRDQIFVYTRQLFPAPEYKILFLIGAVGASFVLALLSWHLLEMPFLRMKERYFRQPTGEPALSEATN